MFQFRHINRLKYPQKHILICEDDLTNQRNILDHFLSIFESQGIVQFSVVPGALQAAAIINSGVVIDLILLDHDMPQGNGKDLIEWMKTNNHKIPIITFSGIDQNNINMMNYGATHLFNKGDVVNGKADNLIRKILNMNIGVAEQYINTISPNNPVLPRYWITPDLLVGGNICSKEDWIHLENYFGIKAVINVDGGHSEQSLGISNLLECSVNDDGTPFSKENITRVTEFAKKNLGQPIYIHCHVGASRSPHFTYAILRTCYNMTPVQALSKINENLPEIHRWGFNQHTTSYINSIENCIKEG